jgi:chromosome segregation ATPase
LLQNLTASQSEVEGQKREGKKKKAELQQQQADINEPHPLLEHLQGLMTALTRSKQELRKCGLDVTPLTTLCNATLESHRDLRQIVESLAKGGTNCSDVIITSDLMHNLVEYIREVLQGLISQGRKLNVQAAFLQQTAKQLNRQQQECLKEQARCQEVIDNDRTRLNQEKVKRNCSGTSKLWLQGSI